LLDGRRDEFIRTADRRSSQYSDAQAPDYSTSLGSQRLHHPIFPGVIVKDIEIAESLSKTTLPSITKFRGSYIERPIEKLTFLSAGATFLPVGNFYRGA